MNEPDLPRAHWHKSSHSSANGQCVEVARLEQFVAVRDSKDCGGPVLTFAPSAWYEFIAGVRSGELDPL